MEYEELAEAAKDDVLQRIGNTNTVPHEYILYVPEEVFDAWLKSAWNVSYTTKTAEAMYGLSNGVFPFTVDPEMSIADGYRIEEV